uniref:L1 transposable element dsRBD-like domain-containing protein n=1 Tax=Molossus molossus TaxID=27622 RepID=A0A7J8HJ05_MOLMO|nr:hypothetical protein HJG59_011024 [Molossus molossus]
MAENFPKLVKEKVTQVLETQRASSKMNPRRPTARHIIIKMANIKQIKNLEIRVRQKVTYKGAPIRLSADFSIETLQARQEWHEVYKVMKGKGLNPRLLYPAKLLFKIEGERKSFIDKNKLKEFTTTKPALQEMLKGLL